MKIGRDNVLNLAIGLLALMAGFAAGVFARNTIKPNSESLWSFAGSLAGAIAAGATAVFVVRYQENRKQRSFESILRGLLDQGLAQYEAYQAHMVRDPNDKNEESRSALFEIAASAKAARSTAIRLRSESIGLARCAQSLSEIGPSIDSAVYQASPSSNYYWHENSQSSANELRDGLEEAKLELSKRH
jgi:hypothetical protein